MEDTKEFSRKNNDMGICKFTIFILVVLCVASSKAYTQESNIMGKVFGRWQVTSYATPGVSGMTDKQAKAFIKKYVVLNNKWASLFNDTCYMPTYSIKKTSTNYYFRNFNTTKKEIKIFTDSIYIVDVNCDKAKYFSDESPEFDGFIYDGTQIHIEYNGILFHLIKYERHSVERNSQ